MSRKNTFHCPNIINIGTMRHFSPIFIHCESIGFLYFYAIYIWRLHDGTLEISSLNTKLADISMDDSVCEIDSSKQNKALLNYLCVLLLIGCLASVYPFIIYIDWFWEKIYCSLEVFHTNRTLNSPRVACFLHLYLTRSETRIMVMDNGLNLDYNLIIKTIID